MGITRAHNVEGAEQINVDHRLKAIGRKTVHQGRKVTCRAGNQHVDLPKLLNAGLEHRLYTVIIPHVGGGPCCLALATRIQGLNSLIQLLLLAAHNKHVAALIDEAFGNAKVNAAGAARNEHGLATDVKINHVGPPFGLSTVLPRPVAT